MKISWIWLIWVCVCMGVFTFGFILYGLGDVATGSTAMFVSVFAFMFSLGVSKAIE